ncbi:hypothetical protein GQ53DRAFT_787405 [Thozetella sp. PMI_491]|nr:hypothetical protein GQ53DRAFT_787405 [Thozetella sp. PMI_491]
MASTFISGAVFGAALTASGVYQPSTIISQFRLENWHMMETFLTAAATSTYVIHRLLVSAFQKTHHVNLSPRCYNSIGLFSFCDGNIIGGALLGIGMALAGSCPGTVLSQIGTGVQTGYYSLGGAILGGIVWTGFLRPVKGPENLTIDKYLAIDKSDAVVAMEVILVSVVSGMATLTQPGAEAKIPPVAGGLLIGFGQFFSLLTRKTTVGVSTMYEEVGDLFWWAMSSFSKTRKPDSFRAIFFGSGLVSGAWLLSAGLPHFTEAPAMRIPVAQALAGGFLMILGARMAGGCTSGHGISGISMLSISSFITIGTAIVAGILTSTSLAHITVQ